MTHFNHLRKIPWSPTFDWYPTVPEVADRINAFHEDYPQRVNLTTAVIEGFIPSEAVVAGHGFYPVKTGRLRVIHQIVFWEHELCWCLADRPG